MKKFTIFLLLIGGSLFASNGENLFIQKCSMCHVTSPVEDKNSLVAPAVFGVMRHVKIAHSTKEKAMVFMNDYVMNPSKEKSVCKPKKIKKFGLMPSQKGNVSPHELKIITSWMYDNFPPKGFRSGRMMRAK